MKVDGNFNFLLKGDYNVRNIKELLGIADYLSWISICV
jgi:hypothetical protein